jgi:phosphate transport system substrate-binding protein
VKSKGELDDGTSVSIDVKAQGTATAFKEDPARTTGAGLEARKVDIGMASRKIKPDEVRLLQDLGKVDEFGPSQGLGGEHVVAIDGIAVIASPLNLMAREISLEDLKKIYSGQITKWEDVPGANGMSGEISPVRRDYLSGTYDFFCEKVMHMKAKKGPSDPTPEPLSAAKKSFEDSDALVNDVISDRQAIGFVGLSYVGDSKLLAIKATRNQMSEESVVPDVDSVRSGRYPLSRPLYLYTANPASDLVKKFIRFTLSDEGQRIVAQEAQSVHIVSSPYELPRLGAPSITSPTMANAEIGKAFEFALDASPKADRFQLSGAVPPWLTLDRSRWIISGTPTASGTFRINVRAANSEGWGDASPLQLTIGVGANPLNVVLRMHGSNSIGGRLAVELAEQFLRERKVFQPEILYGPETQTEEGKARDVYVVGDIDNDGKKGAIEIEPHGSSTGFVGLRKSICEIGLSSRKIKPAEYSEINPETKQSLKDILGDLNYIPERSVIAAENVIGYDGVSVIVNESNALDEIDFKTLRQIYTGQKSRWEDIPESGLQGSISVYTKGPNSGTYQFFQGRVFPDGQLTRDAKNHYEDGQLLARDVSRDRNAIGFVALPDVRGDKVLRVREGDSRAFAPNANSIRSGSYSLVRPLYMYLAQSTGSGTQVTPASLRLAREFVQMVRSGSGQQIVQNNGFVPVAIICPGKDCPMESGQPWRIPFHIHFDTGKALIDARTKQNINIELAGVFDRNPQYRSWTFRLVGYTDNVGSPQRNLELSQRRALQAKRYLEGLLYSVRAYEGRGESEFIGTNDSEAGRAKNRRVEMILEPSQ